LCFFLALLGLKHGVAPGNRADFVLLSDDDEALYTVIAGCVRGGQLQGELEKS
jgi:adenine deaminase